MGRRILVEHDHVTALRGRGAELLHTYPALSLLELPVDVDVPAETITVVDSPTVSVHGRDVVVSEGAIAGGDPPRIVVRFVGPIAPEWSEALRRAGVRIHFWCPPCGACLELPSTLRAADITSRFPFVVGSVPYREGDCTRRIPDPPDRDRGTPSPHIHDLVCFGREAKVAVESALRERGIEVLQRSSSKLRVWFEGDPAELRRIRGVKIVGRARGSRLLTTPLVRALGVPEGRAAAAELDGRGQVVAVADTGLDSGDATDLHGDFDGKVRALVSWPPNPSWNRFIREPGRDDGAADTHSGHGTHVAGVAVGTGTRSDGRHRGVAPGATLVFQALEQYTETTPDHAADVPTGHYLSGRPLDLRELFSQAREYGARIHVNAWGDPVAGAYTDDCWEVDRFCWDHPDAVILFAAGNDGADRDGDGRIDAGTLYAPASAKNAIAIGATEGPSQGVGIRANWGDLDPDRTRFRDRDARSDAISGDPDHIALFSSAGPSADGRIKPDLCAPGTNIVGPRSRATPERGWGLASPLPHYMYNGGTSVATGVAGGYFAVLRQAWAAHRGIAPGGAALRALAVLGSRPVARRGEARAEPVEVAGFGRLFVADSLPESGVTLVEELDPGLMVGEIRRYALTVAGDRPLRAVLAYHDAPGETLVNRVHLRLRDVTGTVRWGNHPDPAARPDDAVGKPDTVNCVERIHLPKPGSGFYVLEVVATNVAQGPQPFALAVRGAAVQTDGPGIDPDPLPPDPPDGPPPAPPSRDIPVEWLSGIGRQFAERLRASGLDRISKVATANPGALADAVGSQAPVVRARMAVFERCRTELSRLGPLDPTTTLVAVAQASALPPPVVRAALPLLCVFDPNRWDDIRLADFV